ncbi:hypothetical protein C8Q80DRAFT_70088 [Daedaleopsis nitida]|nr:hypothetical protein C8Q80DRAFT_70088 [Daedaleopsis nitida]
MLSVLAARGKDTAGLGQSSRRGAGVKRTHAAWGSPCAASGLSPTTLSLSNVHQPLLSGHGVIPRIQRLLVCITWPVNEAWSRPRSCSTTARPARSALIALASDEYGPLWPSFSSVQEMHPQLTPDRSHGPPLPLSTSQHLHIADMPSTDLLSQVRAQLVVDVDSMDPNVAARYTQSGVMFCDMTSNQAIVYNEAIRPDRVDLFKSACAHIQSTEAQLDTDTQVAHTVDLLTVFLAKSVYPYLTGRVHAQTSPSAAYDTEATIAHAKKLVSLFEANGIPKFRVCIKIPATPESIIACKYLEQLGIRTLATCLFSVPQAMAAQQAGCLYVAPYFNELRVHFEPSIWKEYADTAKEHPTSHVISSIVKIYKEIGSSTLIMPASIVTAKEVLGLVSLKPDHLTLSGAVLEKLAAAPGSENVNDAPPEPHHASAPLGSNPADKPSVGDAKVPDVKNINFLENNGAALREALSADAETTRKLADALKIFGEMEAKTKELVRAVLLSD